MAKILITGEKARQDAVSALESISNAVQTTLGPSGLPAILDKPSIHGDLYPTTTKDGVTVISNMSFDEPIHHAIWTFCKAAANHSVMDSGDGTSSSIVLASSVAKMILNNKATTPQAYARKITKCTNEVIAQVRSMAISSEEAIKHVAFTSCNGDSEVADVALQALSMTSSYGTVLIEKNVMASERYQVIRQDGYEAGRGYQWHPTMAVSVSSKAGANAPITMDKPYVFIYNGELQSMEQLEPAIKALNVAKGAAGFNLVCFAYDSYEELGYKLIELNSKCPHIKVIVCKTKRTAEAGGGLQTLLDIAAITGATVLDGGKYKEVTADDLGTCKVAEITTNKTILKGRSPKNTIIQRVQENLNGMKYAKSDMDKDIIAARNAELSEGLVHVIVGGGHMASIQERADRLDDALKAAQAARRGGVVPGCGVTYFKAAELANALPEFITTMRCIYHAVLSNYGETEYNNKEYAVGETLAITPEGIRTGDFIELGVCDAADTICAVLKHGVELGILCATVGAAVLTCDLQKINDFKMIASLAQGKQ